MDSKTFLKVIECTPLVSVDLIFKNSSGQVLLGLRTNSPARGFWFVPGGRIHKNETLADAISRISMIELNIDNSIQEGKLIGAYDHIYTDNFRNTPGINTHYIALGYEFILSSNQIVKSDSQHSELNWWDIDQLMNSGSVHPNTKAYFL